MIEAFRCDNFKSLMKFEIRFSTHLTVIAGANGTGKTTICQALGTMGRLVTDQPQIVMNDICQGDWLIFRNKWTDDNEPYFITRVEGKEWSAIWGIGIQKEDVWDIFVEEVKAWKKDQLPTEYQTHLERDGNHIKVMLYDSEIKKWAETEEIKKIPSYLSTIVKETKDYYPALWMVKDNVKIRYIPFLDPVLLRRKTNRIELGETGQNFSCFLADFKAHNPIKFKSIVAKVKEFFPWLEDVTTKSTKFGWTEIQAKVKPAPGEDNVVFRSWQINDGLLRLLALATIPYAEPDMKMLVFEEPENGIHPKLIGATVELIRSLENIQVVLTTHSPVLLNYLKPEEVVVLVPQGKQGPIAVPFTELDRADERLEYFDVGDILFHEDEWEMAKPYLEKLKQQNKEGKKKE